VRALLSQRRSFPESEVVAARVVDRAESTPLEENFLSSGNPFATSQDSLEGEREAEYFTSFWHRRLHQSRGSLPSWTGSFR